jgi:hypothetical protein
MNEAGNVPAWHTNDPIYDAAQVRGKVLLEINRQMQYCACYANLQEASRQLGELSKFVYSLDARGSGRATWEGDVTHGLAVRALTVYHGEIAGGWPHESVSAMRKALAAVVEAPAYRAPDPAVGVALDTIVRLELRVKDLRAALVTCGSLVGGAVSEKCSDQFLCMITDEVRGFVSKHSTCWPGSSHPVVTELIDALRDSTDHIDRVTVPTRDEDIAVIDRARAAIAKAVTPP